MISLPEWMLSQASKIALGRVYDQPNLTFNLHNVATIGQNEIVPLNHPIKINTLWFQLVYDIEHLNSQAAPDFDLNRLSTVASSVECKYWILS